MEISVNKKVIVKTNLKFFVGMPGFTIYIHWALPALFSGIEGQAAPELIGLSYVIYILTVTIESVLTTCWWRFADQKQ
jgi:hypothetical protein